LQRWAPSCVGAPVAATSWLNDVDAPGHRIDPGVGSASRRWT
jgi:hypothetical protein